MAWIYLFIAGVFEIGFSIALKRSAGLTLLVPSAVALVFVAISLGLLGLAMRTLPLATAYAVWTGIGTVGTVAIGFALGEAATAIKLGSVALILAGIVGLKLAA